MTNEEAIKWLKVESSYIEEDIGHGKEILEAYDMATKALKQTRWIPCSERLPDKDGCYLVSTTGTNNDIIDIAYYTEEIWHKASRIKAWMPLPNPYRGGESDAK